MQRVFLTLLMISLAPAFLHAQNSAGESSPVPIPADIQARLAGLLPEPAEAGAKPASERQFYSSDLYRYIDGAADAFLGFDLVAMIHQEYETKEADITLDIYDMGKPLNAFGMYAAERSPSYHFLSLGVEGYVSDSILNFFQGQYYAKLSAFGNAGKSAPDLVPLAQAISAKIGTEKSIPAALSILPKEHLVAHSEKFANKSPLGHDFLSPAIEATYLIDGKPVVLLISKASDAAGAAERVRQLRDYFSKSGKAGPGPDVVPGGFRGSNKYEGEVVFFSSGAYTVLCVNPPPQPDLFLKEVLDHLANPQVNSSF
ncbi:MAG: DUF6599 family protein [Terriglobia bacterium]